MIKLIVITPWIEEELEDVGDGQVRYSRGPELMVDYPYTQEGEIYKDITAQPIENLNPTPNTFIAEVVRVEATADAIKNDSKYYVISEETV